MVSRSLVAAVLRGIESQGWDIIGRGGSFSKAFAPLEDHIQRRIAKAMKAEREAIIDLVAMHGGSVEIEAAIRARNAA
jgi:hypothetical protein